MKELEELRESLTHKPRVINSDSKPSEDYLAVLRQQRQEQGGDLTPKRERSLESVGVDDPLKKMQIENRLKYGKQGTPVSINQKRPSEMPIGTP